MLLRTSRKNLTDLIQSWGNLIKILVINNSDLSDKIAQSETEESARHKLNLKAESELKGPGRPGIVCDIRWIFNCICFIATYNIYLCFIGSPLNPINCEYNLTKECRQQTPIFATNLPGVFRLSLLCIIISALSWSPWFWYLVGVGSSAGLGCMRRWVSVLWHPRLPPRLWWTQTCCYDREQRISPGQLLSNGWWCQPTNRSLSHHLSDSPPV